MKTKSFEDTVYLFLKKLNRYSYQLSYTDFIWNIFFPDHKKKWRYVVVQKYRETYYISLIDDRDRNMTSLEVESMKRVEPSKQLAGFSGHGYSDKNYVFSLWKPLVESALKWLEIVDRDWMQASARVLREYPLNYRYGIVPNALVRESLSDIYRLDRELGKSKCNTFIKLVENGFFSKAENTERKSMTAADFFAYCKIAYVAGKRKDDHVDQSLSGKEMYKRYADGRHEGLLDIDDTSEKEFADWIDGKHPKKSIGGHPWEIKRGGNTTHINLSVRRPEYSNKDGYKVELCGESIGRLVETVNMFLALHEEKLPVSIFNPEGIRKRLLAQDNIGLVPCYDSLHRANQHFDKEDSVYDVLYYDDLGRFKRRITPFITWEPLPILKPL